MHALQAAYVRATAKNRVDLMKTLSRRREAALSVIAPDDIAEAEAAAAAMSGTETPATVRGRGLGKMGGYIASRCVLFLCACGKAGL